MSFTKSGGGHKLYHCQKYCNFHLISWCGKFVERHSFHIVSGESPETMQKLCISTNFPHQAIRWNYGIFAVYLKESVYYLDCPFVARVYLLLVIEFRVFCMGFLKIFLASFLAYDRYDSYFRTDAHSAKFFPGIINI